MAHSPRAVCVLELSESLACVHGGLIAVPLGARLVFCVRPHTRLHTASLCIWTNLPVVPCDPFTRGTYTSLAGAVTADGEWQAWVDAWRPGAYEAMGEFGHADGDGPSEAQDAPPQRARRRSLLGSTAGSLVDAVAVPPPAAARRGPLLRIVVHPELTVRVHSPLTPLGASSPAAGEPCSPGSPHTGDRPAPHALDMKPATAHGAGVPTSVLLPCACVHTDEREEIRLPLPLDGITLQTQLTRCLGPIDAWLRVHVDPASGETCVLGTLSEPLALRFNFLHFTPVQRLGGSNSAYSLADQLCLEWGMFAGNAFVADTVRAAVASLPWAADWQHRTPTPEERLCVWNHPRVEAAKLLVLQRMIDVIERHHGALSMVDVVMNHTSTDSLWLRQHPEAAYSLKNSPHLRAAFELDETILRVSEAVQLGRVQNVSPRMCDAHAVDAVLDVLRHHSTLGLPATRLWEFYAIDEYGSLAACLASLLSDVSIDEDEADLLTHADNVSSVVALGFEAGGATAPPHTAGVEPADIADERAVEIMAARDATVSAILRAFRAGGYSEGRGDGCVAVTDADLEHLAAAMLQAPPPPPLEDCVRRIKARGQPAELHGRGRASDVPLAGLVHAGGTPLATPAGSPASDAPPPPAYAFPYGRPPNPSQNPSTGAVPHPPSITTPSHASPGWGGTSSARWWQPGGCTESPRRRISPSGVHVTRSGQPVSSPRARSVVRRSNGSEGSAGATRYRASGAMAQSMADLAGGVFTDGSGGRFSVHIDVVRVVAALNKLPGVRIDAAAWTWPPAASKHGTSAGAQTSLPLLPSLHLIFRLVQTINLHLYRRYDADMTSALNAVRGTAHYSWLSVLKGRESLTQHRPLVYSYFARVPAWDGGSVHVLACNGFIWNGDPEIDFTLPVDAARLYAQLVRAGTAPDEFLKRPRDWSTARQAALAEAALGLGGFAALSESEGTAGSHSNEEFPGASLLELDAGHVAALTAAHDRGDWEAIDACWSACALAALDGASLAPGPSEVTPDGFASAASSATGTASDATLQLDPDVIPLPVMSASTPYMRRDIVIWGDCVKLRYGLTPSDSPWLWHRMRVYVRRMARLFHGLRVDNAHGTPLHVASYMMDAARAVRPDVYVNAELFTGSLDRDVEYVSRIGINSLVREAMQCDSSGDFLRAVYAYGGVPIGSLRPLTRGTNAAWRLQHSLPAEQALPLVSKVLGSSQRDLREPSLLLGSPASTDTSATVLLTAAAAASRNMSRAVAVYSCVNGFPVGALLGSTRQVQQLAAKGDHAASSTPDAWRLVQHTLLQLNDASVSSLLPSNLPALFFDCTHDNPTPMEKRHPVDAIATAALVAMSVCPTGTSRGFDILVPENISVVRDMRLYDDPFAAATKNAAVAYDYPSHPFTRPPAPPMAPCAGSSARYGVDLRVGFRLVRRRLNALKQELAARGHSELFCSSAGSPNGSDVITLVRGHPWLPMSYVVIARTALSRYSGDARGNNGPLPVIRLEGQVTDVILAASLFVPPCTLRQQPPEGARLTAEDPWVLSGKAPEGCAFGIPGVEWIAEPEGGASHPGEFNAGTRFINGLAASLQYVDDTMVDAHAPWHVKTLGLASLQVQDSDGAPVTDGSAVRGARVSLLTLDAATFNPGSVLVLKVHTPRNVAIRAGFRSVISPHAADVPHPSQHTASGLGSPNVGLMLASPVTGPQALALPAPASTDVRTTGTAGRGRAESSQHDVMATLALALHGPQAHSEAFDRSLSRASLGSSRSLGDSMLELSMSARGSRRASDGKGTPARGGSMDVALSRAARKLSAFFGPTLSELEDVLLDSPDVTLVSLNALMYKCNSEELDSSHGTRGTYSVPGVGSLPWAGVAGVQQLLRHCRKWNDMAHPLLDNIRSGNWLMDYTVARLSDWPELRGVQSWLERHFSIVKLMPRGLRPQGFDRVMHAVFRTCVAAVLHRMRGPLVPSAAYAPSQHYLVNVPPAVVAARHVTDAEYFLGDASEWQSPSTAHGGVDDEHAGTALVDDDGLPVWEHHVDPAAPLPFLTALALTSVQLWGYTKSAPLLALPLVDPSALADGRSRAEVVNRVPYLPSLAAGVEHFCTGYMRTWGRDTFISFRGLLLTTGRFEEARGTLLSFAAVLRHGLLPNLMDGGRHPRYNCRDAVWWFLQALQDYCDIAPDGLALLRATVRRRFPSDDPRDYAPDGTFTGAACKAAGISAPAIECTLEDVVHEALRCHGRGIHFREWNAGRAIDAHMRDEGFNIDIEVDPESGFVRGGNASNCGTWMDKMGESIAHDTDGVPATPRDGADVEIVALCFSTLQWLAHLQAQGAITSEIRVEFSTGEAVSYAEWASRIRRNFEKHFYVPESAEHDAQHRLDARYVNARGIYKDTVGSSSGWSDYQLRPNQLIALVVAPELVVPDHADAALRCIERRLLGEHQLGVKTLDPADWAYRGDYDNSRDDERSVAKGWNYHQGPEWLWPYGFYLRARILFPPAEHRQRALVPEAKEVHRRPRWRDASTLRSWVLAHVARHRQHMDASPEAALPELTNANGAVCKDSCVSQAWSSATLLDALWDLQHYAADGTA